MQDNMMDIPAIKYGLILCNDSDIRGNSVSHYGVHIKEVSFDQVDGLTIDQFINSCVHSDRQNRVVFTAYVEITDLQSDKPPKVYWYVMNLPKSVEELEQEKDKEISKYYEERLMQDELHFAPSFDLRTIVGTFLARYRGKSKEDIDKALELKLEQ